VFVTIQADSKGGEERSPATPHRRPGAAAHRRPVLVTVPGPVAPRCPAIPTGRGRGASCLRCPSAVTISPPARPLPVSSRPPGRTPRWLWRWCSGIASSGRPGAWRTTGRWGSSGGVRPWGRRASSWRGWRRRPAASCWMMGLCLGSSGRSGEGGRSYHRITESHRITEW